ncbi:MAG: vanadium-dependent haloperoxidase [Saprospiraceae bacterium]|nr:vanadium-dependent haloperoxidase [Saprospiraceae bacterium]
MKIRLALLSLISICHFSVSGQNEKEKVFKPSLANKWLDIALEVTANDVDRYGAKPTIQARQLGIAMNAMYDAWACYDAKAVNSLYGSKLRRPASERTKKNKEKAISYAMLHVLIDQFPLDKKQILEEFQKMGYDPKNYTLDKTKPEGIGNLIARELLKKRHQDGANQLGNEPGSDGKPYSDYTYYRPVNTYKKVIDPDRWHPLPFVKNNGDTFLVNFLTPHWYRVQPFGLKSSSQFRAPEYPKYGSEQLKKEVDECIDFNANLDHTRKSTIEFMRDGPRSTGQAGHWLRFAQLVSFRDHNDLDRDVKMYFVVALTAMDAFIACWETKRFYDSSRPWTLVRQYYKGQTIKGWGGPDKGTLDIPAERWHPYSPADFVSPPFPAYVSGHSTVSGACAKILELFTGSDDFGETENRICGIITETPGDPVSLPLPTFTATAEMAGISRVLGGYHIQADNVEGLKMGRKVAHFLWDDVFQKYFDGTYKRKG